jgi:hypothetical protein
VLLEAESDMIKKIGVFAALVAAGFAVGWITHVQTSAPAYARCHNALRVLMKDAPIEKLSESSKALRGE